ncbi:MAG TPA: diaminopimelate epimerase [Candidatus Heimdallarchaeota archaeon]|nr:diaminopimelate epimerase [Candidatus Heimdallarchaeota archaeon]
MNNSVMKFVKMSATGNDFILIDNRSRQFSGEEKEFFRKICQRRIGVGADGVILLEESEKADLKYRHINADGGPAEMCGNGARSLCYFAVSQKIAPPHLTFEIEEEIHEAWVAGEKVKLRLPPPSTIQNKLEIVTEGGLEEGGFIILGVPHLVLFTKALESIDVVYVGRQYSYHPLFENRTNVNFVQQIDAHTIQVRTYERGVENETLSCGTGSTASAILAHLNKGISPPVEVQTSGGVLRVDWEDIHHSVFLTGTASVIFEAELKDFD